MGPVKLVVTAFVVYVVAQIIYTSLYAPAPVPDLPVTNYWGFGDEKPSDTKIYPFKINVPDSVLSDLKTRLDLDMRLQPSLEGVNFEYGFHVDELIRVVNFWRNEYNWREREALLNKLPQFTTQVFGLQLHFIHAKPANVPKNVEVVPLLLLHGFPGTVKEFYDFIPLLTTVDKDRDFVFEVVAPSLPGYAFSEPAHKPGMSPAHMAVMFRHLMLRLGHSKFYIQGGDWGSIITADLAALFPDNVLGIHSTMCAIQTPLSMTYLGLSSLFPRQILDADIADSIMPLSDFVSKLFEESGYLHIQATKPDTIGVGLNSSPAGLAAYILEKFSSWTDMAHRELSDGGLTRKFSLPDLLDNVMLYWVTGSITSSMRIYAEYFASRNQNLNWDRVPVTVPSFCAQFPKELLRMPEFIIRLKYTNLLPKTMPDPEDPLYSAIRPPRGGHFASFEEPHLMAYSLVRAVELFRNT